MDDTSLNYLPEPNNAKRPHLVARTLKSVAREHSWVKGSQASLTIKQINTTLRPSIACAAFSQSSHINHCQRPWPEQVAQLGKVGDFRNEICLPSIDLSR